MNEGHSKLIEARAQARWRVWAKGLRGQASSSTVKDDEYCSFADCETSV